MVKVNRRIILFGLIVVLGLTVLTFGKNLIENRLSAKDDEIEIIRSDENEVVLTEEEGIRKTVMYFKDADGYLVPVMKRIPWEEGIAKVTLNNMVDSAELREMLSPTGLLPVIPAGTEILGMSINEDTGLCKIDFSENVLNNQSEKDEESFIKGVVYTLTEFPAISEVQILVGGKALPSMTYGGNISQPLARENINLVGSLEEGRSKVVVYYKGMNNEEYEYFVPVTIPTLAPVANVYSALDLLFDGPPVDIGLFSDIPKDVMLHGVEVKDGTAYVDISYDNMDTASDDTFSDIIKNIGLTLSQFSEIETVELLIDGEIINTTIPVFANEY
ncbi:GerMN domain-containing protein [Tissierella pigra]|uniref:GerMN domain-containing protein n=1 Tax=Tissierella pigra TaxID=2607614 RepID=A0A6N7XR88_9FIRM|nr:GerMN domain-containing protein [Tissierella pigra]MBU5427518.1 GerMN domain-containing protein [Tissierella pigra]MSU00267.1 GerMN domain-containing protein [Tissierella pigra]